MSTKKEHLEYQELDTCYHSKEERFLVLHNDEVNDFNFVISTLVDVCEHRYEQAYQCALITHHKGKCEIKKGNFRTLSPLKAIINDRGLEATID